MKRLLKGVGIALMACVFMLSLSACQKVEEEVKETVDNVISAVKGEFETIAADAKADAEKVEEVAEEDVQEAIDYIKEHIAEPLESTEVAQKLIQYANKLKAWGESTAELAEHDLTVLGQKVHDYMSKLIVDGEELGSDVAAGLKTDIDEVLEKVDEAKDTIVADFKALFDKK